MVFGINCSPFLLNATIDVHLKSYQSKNYQLAQNLLNNLYVDDVASGVSSVEDGIQFFKFTNSCMRDGGFQLRKWCSNSDRLNAYFSDEESTGDAAMKDDDPVVRYVLGLKWNVNTDTFVFSFEEIIKCTRDESWSKRSILKAGARFYDPLGIISPIIIQAKLIFQKLCRLKTDWDANIPDDIREEWTEFMEDLKKHSCIIIPRYVGYKLSNVLSDIELHGFSDSSQTAYSAVVYAKIKVENKCYVKLLASKTKVAPLKMLSIPRLELLVCLLLSKLVRTVVDNLDSTVLTKNKFLWTDSKICVAWIRNTHREWVS